MSSKFTKQIFEARSNFVQLHINIRKIAQMIRWHFRKNFSNSNVTILSKIKENCFLITLYKRCFSVQSSDFVKTTMVKYQNLLHYHLFRTLCRKLKNLTTSSRSASYFSHKQNLIQQHYSCYLHARACERKDEFICSE